MSDSPEENAKTIVYPDTNYFLHWPPFSTADWRGMLDAAEVEVVVASVVFYELEKHKDRNPKAGVRRRALKTTSDLESMQAERAAGARLGEGVMVRVLFDSAPPEGHASDVLAKDVADDRILAAMMKAHDADPDARIVVLTGDRPLRMKARAHGFEAIEPPAAQRERDDAEETELAALRRERDEEASRKPRPWVSFGNDESRYEHPNRSVTISEDEFVQNRMAALRKSCPKRQPQRRSPFAASWESAEDIAEYNLALDSYYPEAEAFLRSCYRRAVERYRMPRLDLRLANAGNATATNVRVTLSVAEGLRFWNPADYPPEDDPPRTPSAPRSVPLPSSIGSIPRRDEFELPPPRASSAPRFTLSPDGRSAWYEFPSLVHNAPRDLPQIGVAKAGGGEASAFSVAWSISCQELSRSTEHGLNVTVAAVADDDGAADFTKRLLSRFETDFEAMVRSNPELWKGYVQEG